jgi:hypothetical protein
LSKCSFFLKKRRDKLLFTTPVFRFATFVLVLCTLSPHFAKFDLATSTTLTELFFLNYTCNADIHNTHTHPMNTRTQTLPLCWRTEHRQIWRFPKSLIAPQHNHIYFFFILSKLCLNYNFWNVYGKIFRVIWFQAITISQSWRNAITMRVFWNLLLQFSTSLKYAT